MSKAKSKTPVKDEAKTPKSEKPVDTLKTVASEKKPIVRIETYKNGYRVSGYFTDKQTGLEAYDFLHARYLETRDMSGKKPKQEKTETVTKQ